jgi:uncharacterized cupredoxin-like copper-binding protein
VRRGAALTFAILATLATSGCGEKRAETAVHPKVVQVAERDFRIKAPERLPAGDVVLSVKNRGPDDHELILLREGKAHAPFRADGITIDEDAVERSIAGALEPGGPGTRRLRVHLKPGRYVMFCNMAGHYLGGMDKDLVVQ